MNDTDIHRIRQGICAFVAVLVMAAPAAAQDELEGILGNLGTASAVDEEAAPTDRRAGEGTIRGQVFDGATGLPIRGATVIVMWPAAPDGGDRPQEVLITDADGGFELPSVPPGAYDVSFVKSGYRSSAMTGFEVRADQVNVADFPLPPLSAEVEGAVLDLDAFVVEADTVGEMMDSLDIRMDSSAMVNVMSSEDFSKYAASDVADALKRVAGVNVVEGQFAIIRGLEDRYSSTLYNGAPVPSPDPDRQSVQLDLFPSEVVSNLVVAKTFTPGLPSNSSGGSIDIVTHGYPDSKLKMSAKLKGGANERVLDGPFLDYVDGSPTGKKHEGAGPFETEVGGQIGGRFDLQGREIRFNAVGNFNRDFSQSNGFRETREPRDRFADSTTPGGDLSDGELSLTGGRFELDTSAEEWQETYFGAFGFDLDEAGDHQLDGSVLWTKKKAKVVQLRQNGYLPGFDYAAPNGPIDRELQGLPVILADFLGTETSEPGRNAALSAWIADSRDNTSSDPNRGPLWFSSFAQSASFKSDRELQVEQVNGDHTFGSLFGSLEGLHLGWAANHARSTQDDESVGLRYWYEPCGFSNFRGLACPTGVNRIDVPTEFPVTVDALGPGLYVASNDIFQSANEIDEEQWFARADLDYERGLADSVTAALEAGYWYERAKRDVKSSFLEGIRAPLNLQCVFRLGLCTGSSSNPAVFGESPGGLGQTVFEDAFLLDDDGFVVGTRFNDNDSKREIHAGHVSLQGTFWDDLDVFGGARIENIRITSRNDPFQAGFEQDGTPLIFPSKFLLFDRFGDNVLREGTERDPPFNDQVIGFDSAEGICRGPNPAQGVPPADVAALPGTCVDLVSTAELRDFVNGEIDETKVLPSVGLTWRATPELTLRAAFSQTVARPSFREMGYYVSVEPASDDLIVGNPQLGLSDVDSYDGRVEYVFGDSGDLFALSGFYKEIQDPIESIILRDPVDTRSTSAALFRTFFNNPNEATLWGIEVEARKSLDFVGVDFLEHFSLGGNFTYIGAEVKRTRAELDRSEPFFAEGKTLKKNRRLFGQPEWIANGDVTFDHPAWGTKLTLAVFGISDVLDAAGSAFIGPDGTVQGYTLDRYVGRYYTLDLVARQQLWEGVELRFTAKNLTDSKRELVYDPSQTSGRIPERSFRVGRDYTLQLTFTFDSDSWF